MNGFISNFKYTFFIFLITGCAQKNNSSKTDHLYKKKMKLENNYIKSSNDLVEMLYASNGVNLDLEKIFMIQDLIKKLLTLSNKEEKQTALAVIKLLKENSKETTELDCFINQYLILHFQNIAHNEKVERPFESHIINLAKKIVDYIEIEQTNILNNEKTKHLFITILHRCNNSNKKKIYQLPRLINFWNTESGETILYNYDPSDSTKIQMIGGMIIDMTIMMGSMMGASMANSQIGMQGQQLSNQINKNSQTIQTNMQAFKEQMQKKQSIELQAMISAFSQAQQDIQTKTQEACDLLNQELNYLYKNISISQPQQNYIFNQIQYDQLFALGTMLTPTGPLWKNPFSVGDWEYEKDTNSFWQYQNTPITNTITDNDGNKKNSSLQAENNAIFAEYFTSNENYTIAGSITIYAINYPFFTGIIFNKSRWISGDFESIRKCRMIGLYGKSPTDLGIYFAQQYNLTNDQIKNNPSEDPIQTPLQQIINNKIEPSIVLPQDFLKTLPATLYFSIQNSRNSITITVRTDTHTLPSTTINKLDGEIYTYHGIGFICPGAIAEFNLTQPTDFIFSKEAISHYKD